MKTNHRSAAAHRFAIVFPSGKHNNGAELEKHTKALQDYCKEIQFCTQQDFDNFKTIAAQMWPGLVSNAIAHARVKLYVAERTHERANTFYNRRGLIRRTLRRERKLKQGTLDSKLVATMPKPAYFCILELLGSR